MQVHKQITKKCLINKNSGKFTYVAKTANYSN